MSKTKKDMIRERAENDLKFFINLVHPHRVLGQVHEDLIDWWDRSDAKSHQLALLPRDHMKSALIAYRVAHRITKNPALRVMYISATEGLAVKQLKFIKDILLCDNYRRYWPEMVNLEEGRREKWTEYEIAVDHPTRKAESIRDATIFTAGLNATRTGFHADIVVLDDLVVRENAYTEDGRSKVRALYSLLASIEAAEAQEWVVGTRYDPRDLYNDMVQMEYEVYDDKTGEVVSAEPLYEKFERQVEDAGDGTGTFLWPRQQRADGKWFGFDRKILAKKRAQYLDKTQFRAQYYNDPNDASTAGITPSFFQYYDRAFIKRRDGHWHYNNNRLNVFAAIDFAYSLSKKADFTTIVVVGVDSKNNYYILDIERFKTQMIKEYFERIMQLYIKWDFRKLRAEVNAAQEVIVKDLKENYIKPNGLALSVDEARPNRHQGKKEERIEATLVPKYQNLQMWHYQGGNCSVLEEELILQRPPHDDVKDALTACLDICVPPSSPRQGLRLDTGPYFHGRFGGVS